MKTVAHGAAEFGKEISTPRMTIASKHGCQPGTLFRGIQFIALALGALRQIVSVKEIYIGEIAAQQNRALNPGHKYCFVPAWG